MLSASSMIVIRVLPGDGMTAPRLPLLKSYSSRVVLNCLAATGLASGNHARPLFALDVNDDQHAPQSIHTQCHETLFSLGVRIFDRECHRIAKYLFCVRETDAMLAKVGPGFGWVELD